MIGYDSGQGYDSDYQALLPALSPGKPGSARPVWQDPSTTALRNCSLPYCARYWRQNLPILNPQRLTLLIDLRRAAQVSLEQAAQACGLGERAGRDSVSAWEQGRSVPHPRRRPYILRYLLQTLRLDDQPARLAQVWGILVEEWGWEPLRGDEMPRLVAYRTPSDDRILLPAPLPSGSRMPYSRNPHFVGRLDDLRALALVIRSSHSITSSATAAPIQHTNPVIAVTGMGGIGKTQLAVEFAHRYGQFFPGGIFWLSFADPDAIPDEVAACGGENGLALDPAFAAFPLVQQIAMVRAAWDEPIPRLLIFDSCEEPALLDEWRPVSGGSAVIVTSRVTGWNRRNGVQTLPLGLLSRGESIELLQSLCPARAAYQSAYIALAAELDDLPLALHLAGSFLARFHDTISPLAYLGQLRTAESGQTGLKEIALGHASFEPSGVSPTGYHHNLATTIALSYDQLGSGTAIDRVARLILERIASLTPGELIPYELLSSAPDMPEERAIREEALARLIELGLIEETGLPTRKTLRAHRLVMAFVRQRLADT